MSGGGEATHERGCLSTNGTKYAEAWIRHEVSGSDETKTVAFLERLLRSNHVPFRSLLCAQPQTATQPPVSNHAQTKTYPAKRKDTSGLHAAKVNPSGKPKS